MSTKRSKREKMRRLLALIMVIFLLISVLATAIYFFGLSVSASTITGMTQAELIKYLEDLEKERDEGDTSQSTQNADDDDDTPDGRDTERVSDDIMPESDDKLIRVGLMYGTNVTVGFETDAEHGFGINLVRRTDDLTHERLWELDQTKISCTVDANLSKSAMTYSKTSNTNNSVIGEYHIEIGKDMTRGETEELIRALTASFNAMGIYAIPAYIDGGYRLRAGAYSSQSIASVSASTLAAAYPGLDVHVAAPTSTAVSVVDPLSDRILFEYDDNDVTALGLTALDSPTGERAYLVTPAKKSYDGVFMFRRYISGNTDGVSLTDVIPLGEYIKGVLPYEISNSWPLEAQKAFAICVRSFTLSSVRHESAYQFDLCNNTHCQVYNGRTLINDVVEQAVEETAGLVMTYGGEIVTAYYSAVAGGVTVGVDDAWGGPEIPYLKAVETPWEIYTNHTYGVWTSEVSPTELCSYLRNTKGYSQLSGEIKSITIDSLAKNSTYVYQITFTDSYGNKATVKTTDGVRTALSQYVRSANFVVGKGSVETVNTTFTTVAIEELKARTEGGTLPLGDTESVGIITANGRDTTELKSSAVMTASGKLGLDGTSSTSEKTIVTASDPNNFIFAGKGWGHGVGLSQVGVRDLANLGYEATAILEKYFTDIDIRDWQDILG